MVGVSDPPAAAPPECAVAAVAAAKSAWAHSISSKQSVLAAKD